MSSTDNNSSKLLNNVFIRLAVYYTIVLGLMFSVVWVFPEVTDYIEAERNRVIMAGGKSNALTLDQASNIEKFAAPQSTIPVVLSMIGALMLSIPVAWVFRWTRQSGTETVRMTQALVLLPIAIALVVFLVKGSLALAFSLAGIVAVVRFRTTLSDSRDSVFMFVVIGIGLAAGVQLLLVAFASSLIFNLLALEIHRIRFAVERCLRASVVVRIGFEEPR